MLLLGVLQPQYRRNRQDCHKHNSYAHKSPESTVVSLLDAASLNKITGAFPAAVTEVFRRAYISSDFCRSRELVDCAGRKMAAELGLWVTEIVDRIRLAV